MGFLSGLFGGGSNNNERQANNLLNAGAQTGQAQANTAFGQGQNFLNASMPAFQNAMSAYQKPMDFYSALLSGDQGKAMSVLSPQINQINQASANANRAAAQFSPMGGGRSGQMVANPFQRESQISNLYSSLLPAAAQGLTGIGAGLTGLGGTQGGIGTNMYGVGSNLLSGANTAANDMYTNALRQQQLGSGVMGGLGSGLFGLLTSAIPGGSILGKLGGLFSSGGGSGGSGGYAPVGPGE